MSVNARCFLPGVLAALVAALGPTPVDAQAATGAVLKVEALPGTIVRWSVPGTKRCSMGTRSWAALQETCYYPIDLLQTPAVLRVSRRGAGPVAYARIAVLASSYGAEDITLGNIPQANPSPADLRRNARDQALVGKVWTPAARRPIHRPRRLVKWNEFEGPFFTLRASAGVILDAGTYAQDAGSREQFDLQPDWQVRDFRVMLNGRIKTRRAITWCAGLMYDGPNDQWLVRQTGLMIAIPELKGHVFIGRSKEGVSLNMVMVGYAGWTMERSITVVATVPLLADGVKWMGYLPKKRFLYNRGWYTDLLSEGQSFSSYDQQLVARVGFLPILEENGTLLHVALAGRYGLVNDRHGGRFWRLTPMVNWYPSDNLRLEFAYGGGQLDRFESSERRSSSRSACSSSSDATAS